MASYTTNLNLKKPAGSEAVAIGDINNNMDAIDQAYGTLNGNIAANGSKIKHGKIAMRVNQSAGGYSPETYDVEFTTPFPDDNYHVVVTNTNGGGGDWNQIVIAATAFTKDGFSVIANDNKVGSATNILLYVDWVAIHN